MGGRVGRIRAGGGGLARAPARIEDGLPRERTLYASLEYERLPCPISDGWSTPEWRRFPVAAEHESWLVLDEVRNEPGWERFVRRLLDRSGLRIGVTGSSAKRRPGVARLT